VAATTAGGLTTAMLLWLLSGLFSPLPDRGRVAVFAVLAVLVLLAGHGFLGVRLPQKRQQIPRTVFDRSPAKAAARFGYELGTGLRTYLPSAAPHVLAIGLVVLGGPAWAAAALGIGFGLGRGLLPAQRALAPDPRRWDARAAIAGPVVRGAGEAMALVGLLAVAMLLA
jgi:hypothetical protein